MDNNNIMNDNAACVISVPADKETGVGISSFYNQFIDTMGLPIMLLVITYACKILIHNKAKGTDFWKAAIEFPIDFMSIAISVYVTFKYMSVGSNVFLTEVLYFVLAVIVCCFSRKAILNNTCVDKIGTRQMVIIILT